MFNLFSRFQNLLLASIRGIIFVSFTFSIICYLIQTLSRILFNVTPFSFDATINYSFVIAAISGAVYNVHLNENISISVLQKVSKHRLLQLILDSVSFIISCLMLYIFFSYTKYFIHAPWKTWISSTAYIYLFFVATFCYFVNILKSIRK